MQARKVGVSRTEEQLTIFRVEADKLFDSGQGAREGRRTAALATKLWWGRESCQPPIFHLLTRMEFKSGVAVAI